MWMTVHYIQNAFTDLEFSTFTQFDQNYVFLFFLKGKSCKSPSGIRIMTNTMKAETVGKEKKLKLYLILLLISIGSVDHNMKVSQAVISLVGTDVDDTK